MKIYNSLLELIGNTPLLNIARYCEACTCKTKILAKIEAFNPCGSAKDRIARGMIEAMEEELLSLYELTME